MNIKEIVVRANCKQCTYYKQCDYLSNNEICNYADKTFTQYTQQIISEIVGELEKIPTKLRKLKEEGAQYDYETVLNKTEVIETIKKMGEV